MSSSDGKTRDLVTTIPGAGWDFGISRHPYFEFERPLGPHYTVYNRRLMACRFKRLSTQDGYWLLRQKAGVLHSGELPTLFEGADAERLLDRLFTQDITSLKSGRCGYALACYEDGGLIVDGILLRLAQDKFWFAQADGDFFGWAKAHASGLDVEVSDPEVFVSLVQGPNSMQVLEAACDDDMPVPFGYFTITQVSFGGQKVVISRTGYSNELGWEFYTEPHHDAAALWKHLHAAGTRFDMIIHGLDAMNIRRIEAGILNAGSDFDRSTTPYDVGLGYFVDTKKKDFIGKAALEQASRAVRLIGLKCLEGQPHIGGAVYAGGETRVGKVTAGATSPFLKCGIGIALMDKPGFEEYDKVMITCIDGKQHEGELVQLPMYDKLRRIPRGKLVDIPERG
ncbi:MAG: aminomethyltransferase family protein [Gammaproteobacteria bacterium]